MEVTITHGVKSLDQIIPTLHALCHHVKRHCSFHLRPVYLRRHQVDIYYATVVAQFLQVPLQLHVSWSWNSLPSCI